LAFCQYAKDIQERQPTIATPSATANNPTTIIIRRTLNWKRGLGMTGISIFPKQTPRSASY
jgi:hypothetical protein